MAALRTATSAALAAAWLLAALRAAAGAQPSSACAVGADGQSQCAGGDDEVLSALQTHSPRGSLQRESESELQHEFQKEFGRGPLAGDVEKLELGQQSSNLGDSTSDCYLEKEDCTLASLHPGRSYRIFPGGLTQCLNKEKPYFFTVTPGDRTKLLYYFQGGGACWNNETYMTSGFCLQEPYSETPAGIMDMQDPRNPYHGYSSVYVQYCSGDIHAGNTTQTWGPGAGEPVKQVGFYNANAAFEWTKANFPKLEKLSLGGCSAGSLGLQWWANKLLDTFHVPDQERPVLYADSFLGVVFPPTIKEGEKFASFLTTTWKLCDTGLLPAELQQKCSTGKLQNPDLWGNAMASFPGSNFNIINSKADGTQIDFTRALSFTMGNFVGAVMTPSQYFKSVNLLLQTYSTLNNYQAFLVDGQQHCFTPYEIVYTATPLGPDAAEGEPSMIDWIASMPATNGPGTICMGPPKKVSLLRPAPKGTEYCDKALAPPPSPTLSRP